ncbi:MAG: DUF721 domain-containing protein [Armatimonadota bacterium]|nr:DUF721 domain-containing protein [Armatimonadota bacterium]
MRRRSDLSSMKDLVSGTLKRYHLETRTNQEKAASYWAEVVGEKAASASAPDTIRDGILFVNCRSSTWAQELTFLKPRIIEELNKRAGGQVIKDIRFSGSGLKKAKDAAGGEEEDHPSPNEIQDIELGGNELKRVAQAAEGVTDEKLAAKIRNAMESGQKFEQWRLARGWRKCRKCGDLYKGLICFSCQLSADS